MNTAFICLPIAFLIASVIYANRSVKRGASRKKAVVTQMISFAAVCLVSLVIPMAVSAATTGDAATAAAAVKYADKGMSMMAIAIADGIASIGGGLAVAASAPAAIGATGEDPKVFGKALIFVALGEGIAIYGLLLGILMLNKIA